MITRSSLFLLLSTASLCFGCAPAGDTTPEDEAEQPVGEAREALAVNNAGQLNGTFANSSFLNGVKQNGVKQNGVKQNGVKQNSSGLEGTDSDTGLTISGTGYAGATMDAVLGDSSEVVVDISSVSEGDVTGMFTYEITLDGVNVCGTEGAKAVLVPGRWDYLTASYIEDPDLFTVACRGAAIAKCTEWGYRNWEAWTEDNGVSTQDVSLNHFQEACVRMVRADYCGDGVAHTETGTPIEVYDTAAILSETPGNPLALEAEWSESGATCVKHVRWTATNAAPAVDVEDYITDNCPTRWAGPSSSSCGGASSEYFTANGFTSSPSYVAPIATRPLLRNASDQHTH